MTAIAVKGQRVQAVWPSGDANNDGRLTTGEVIEARLTFNEPVHLTDGGIPLSCILTSASLHGSQAAIPLATMTVARVTNLYDLMDSACDAFGIRAHSASMGHVAIIDVNPRSTTRKRQLTAEAKAQRSLGHVSCERLRYLERSTVERVNGRLKDDFGSRQVRVCGDAKVLCHLMFGILALTVAQLVRILA